MQEKANNRIYRLDFLKFISALVIMTLHYNWQIVPQGYLMVELFFMLEGFFIAESCLDSTKKDLFGSLLKQFSKIYFFYFFGIILTIIINGISLNPNHILHNLLFFPIFGLSDDGVSGALWFFGPYLFCLAFYKLLISSVEVKKLNMILFLIITLGILSEAYFAPIKCINFTLEKDAYVFFLPFGYVRGLTAVGIGIFTNFLCRRITVNKILLTFLQLFSLVVTAFIIFHNVTPNYDYIVYLIFPCIIASFYKDSCVNKILEVISNKLNFILSLSLPIYVCHPAYINVKNRMGGGGYVCLVFITSFVVMLCFEMFYTLKQRLKKGNGYA